MKLIITLFITLIGLSSNGQKTKSGIAKHRKEHQQELLDTANHMLSIEEIKEFQGLD